MKLINCLALAVTGDWFTSEENITAFRQANPYLAIVRMGQQVQILKRSLLSFNTTGKVVGFDRSSSGRILILVKWHKDAAPLRVGIDALMPNAPKKFYMVIPLNEMQQNQFTSYSGEARRVGVSPAVHRFATVEDARRYIEREQRSTNWQNYAILESSIYVAGLTQVNF